MTPKRFFIVAITTALLGAGCWSPSSNPTPPPSPSTTSTSTESLQPQTATVLVSTQDRLTFCNGADMDSDGYRQTLTKPKTITLSSTELSPVELAKETIMGATEGMCQQVIRDSALVVKDGTLTIPQFGAWAGVSITMCSCRPEVEVNALRVPGITKVVWQ